MARQYLGDIYPQSSGSDHPSSPYHDQDPYGNQYSPTWPVQHAQTQAIQYIPSPDEMVYGASPHGNQYPSAWPVQHTEMQAIQHVPSLDEMVYGATPHYETFKNSGMRHGYRRARTNEQLPVAQYSAPVPQPGPHDLHFHISQPHPESQPAHSPYEANRRLLPLSSVDPSQLQPYHQAPGYGDALRAPAMSSLQPSYLKPYYEASRCGDRPRGHNSSALQRWDRERDYLPSHAPDEDTEDNPQPHPYETQHDCSRYPEWRNGVEYVSPQSERGNTQDMSGGYFSQEPSRFGAADSTNVEGSYHQSPTSGTSSRTIAGSVGQKSRIGSPTPTAHRYAAISRR
ncbi:hypothetical protein FPQ18DRAFT_393575 [Pyronema domesticum]|nr:hypothetical protein FPQ18DRAFT_393575 [Pyronema domesticum]